jgi:hypothetical protein
VHLLKSVIWYLLIGISVFILYGFLPGEWWYGDDPEIIVFALQHSPSGYLFNPEIWQSLSPFNLTPWILLSLQFDIPFSYFNPAGYYVHHFLSLAVIAMVLFSVMNLYVGRRVFAFIGVLVFLLSPASFAVSSWLTTRHYLEGLGFSFIALYFFVKSIRTGRLLFLFLSSLCYIPAVLSKEVYVPLPFLLMLIPERTFRDRLTHAFPLFILFVFYAVYRFWMLGNNPVGGYSSIWPWTIKSALLNSGEVFRLYAGSWWIVILVFLTVTGSVLLWNDWRKACREAIRCFLIFLLLLIPILPVSSIWGGGESLRYLFLTSTSITFFYILSLNDIWKRGNRLSKIPAAVCLIVVLVGFLQAFYRERGDFDKKRTAAYVEGTFFLEKNNILDAVFQITQPHWFFDGLEKMQAIQSQRPAERRIRLVSGDFYGLDGDRGTEVLRIFMYDSDSRNIQDLTEVARKKHQEFLKTLRESPLHVSLEITKGIMDLHLGPYRWGNYFMLEAPPAQPEFYYLAFPTNGTFGIKLTHRERVRIFRFAYQSPEGWMTVSPKFLIDREKDQAIQWRKQ